MWPQRNETHEENNEIWKLEDRCECVGKRSLWATRLTNLRDFFLKHRQWPPEFLGSKCIVCQSMLKNVPTKSFSYIFLLGWHGGEKRKCVSSPISISYPKKQSFSWSPFLETRCHGCSRGKHITYIYISVWRCICIFYIDIPYNIVTCYDIACTIGTDKLVESFI